MLDEPQHRVGDDVVVAAIRLGIVSDEPEPRTATRRASLGDALAACLRDDRPVRVGDRARDPDDVVVLGEAVERGHEAAAAAAGDDLAVGVARVDHRAPVRDDDQPAALAHAVSVCARQRAGRPHSNQTTVASTAYVATSASPS